MLGNSQSEEDALAVEKEIESQWFDRDGLGCSNTQYAWLQS
jgi:hypothetical protein